MPPLQPTQSLGRTKGSVGINMVDLEEYEGQEVERIYQNYNLGKDMINMERLMQPVLPPIKKVATIKARNTSTGLDRTVLQEIDNMMRLR